MDTTSTSTTATVTVTEGSDEQQSGSSRHRKLLGSNNGPNPPPEDIADASYIVKPAIGASFQQVFETMNQTLLSPPETGITASSFEYWVENDGSPSSVVPYQYESSNNGKPSSVVGSSQYDSWKSKPIQSYPEWLEVSRELPLLFHAQLDVHKTHTHRFPFRLTWAYPRRFLNFKLNFLKLLNQDLTLSCSVVVEQTLSTRRLRHIRVSLTRFLSLMALLVQVIIVVI